MKKLLLIAGLLSLSGCMGSNMGCFASASQPIPVEPNGGPGTHC